MNHSSLKGSYNELFLPNEEEVILGRMGQPVVIKDESLDMLDRSLDAKVPLSFAIETLEYRSSPIDDRTNDYVEMIGVTDNGRKISVSFDFQLFFYLSLPATYSPRNVRSTVDRIKKQMGENGKYIVGYEYQEMEPARGFAFKRKTKLLKLLFNKRKDQERVYEELKKFVIPEEYLTEENCKNVGYDQVSNVMGWIMIDDLPVQVIIYENTVGPLERFSQMVLNATGWMTCQKWIDLDLVRNDSYQSEYQSEYQGVDESSDEQGELDRINRDKPDFYGFGTMMDIVDYDPSEHELEMREVQFSKKIKTRLEYVALETDQLKSDSTPGCMAAVVDIETSGLDCRALDAEVYMISLIFHDSQTNQIRQFLFTWNPAAESKGGARGRKLKDLKIPGVRVVNCSTEEETLTSFLKVYKRFNPDAVVWHNGYCFDYAYIVSRCVHYDVEAVHYMGRTDQRSRMMKKSINGKDAEYAIMHGRLQFDTMFFLQAFDESLPSYALENCCNYYLKNIKADSKDPFHQKILECFADLPEMLTNCKGGVEGEEITKHFKGGDYEMFKKLGVYCVKDSLLTLRLFVERLVFLKTWKMGISFRASCQDILTSGKQKQVFPNILRKMYKKGLYFNRYHDERLDPLAKYWQWVDYPGGLVRDPIMGRYTKPVAVFDFAQMYPSIMMMHNVCLQSIIPLECLNTQELIELKNIKHVVKKIELAGRSVHIVLVQEENVGFTPEIQKDMSEWRKNAKLKMKNAKTPELKAIYDCEQLAYKVYMNGMYGLFAPRSGGRFSFLLVAAAVTQFGREMSMSASNFLITHPLIIDKNPKVVYGDTDSIFVTHDTPTEYKTNDDIMRYHFKVNKQLEKDVSAHFKSQFVKVELEKIFYPMILWDTKKYYTGKKWSGYDEKTGVVYPPAEKATIVGFDGKKRDRCVHLRETQFGLSDKLLDFEFNEVSIIRDLRKALFDLANGRVPIEKLVIVKGIKNEIAAYKNQNTPHVAVAVRNRTNGLDGWKKGSRVSYIVYTDSTKYKQKGGDPSVSPWCENIKTAIQDKLVPDVYFYITNHYKKSLEKLLRPFKIDFEELIKEPTKIARVRASNDEKQMKLFDIYKGQPTEKKQRLVSDEKFLLKPVASKPKQLMLSFDSSAPKEFCKDEKKTRKRKR